MEKDYYRTRDRTQKKTNEKFKIKRRDNKIRKTKKDLWVYTVYSDFKTHVGGRQRDSSDMPSRLRHATTLP